MDVLRWDGSWDDGRLWSSVIGNIRQRKPWEGVEIRCCASNTRVGSRWCVPLSLDGWGSCAFKS